MTTVAALRPLHGSRDIVEPDAGVYCPRTVTFCPSARPRPAGGESHANQGRGRWRIESINRRARRKYIQLLNGLEYGPCYLVTFKCRGDVSRPSGMDIALRENEWRAFWKRLRRRFPAAEAWTVFEYHPYIGAHLHAVIRNVPGLTSEWAQHEVLDSGSEAVVNVVPVRPGTQTKLARYLTKDLADRVKLRGWPKYFHPTSATRGWCPD